MKEVKIYHLSHAGGLEKGEKLGCISVYLKSDYESLREELVGIKEGMAYRGSLFGKVQMQRDEFQQLLTAAEQRNAELVELLDSAFFRLDTFIEAEREMPIPSMEVLRDAILRHCPDLKPTESGASE